jgi:hypothetical protein
MASTTVPTVIKRAIAIKALLRRDADEMGEARLAIHNSGVALGASDSGKLSGDFGCDANRLVRVKLDDNLLDPALILR